jgi:uncharacterized protein (TIGR02118 family)
MIRVAWLFQGKDEESYVRTSFLPLVTALPGATQIRFARVVASAAGDLPARFILEAHFASEDEMNEAFASAEGRRISREIIESAGKGMEMLTLEVLA